MCYAIPAKIIEIKGENAMVDYGGVIKEVNISLMECLSENDYVLVHAGFAIETVDNKTAEDALKLIKYNLK